jgi:hypothetical protein
VKRPLRLLVVAASLLALVGAALAVGGRASVAGTPFYLVPPTPRQECHNVKDCASVIGPWVVVPADGVGTFMLECPQQQGPLGATISGARHGFVGGTDTRASSPNVQVWFDGQIGAPISQSITTGGSLLFHGITTNGKAGTFEPVIGCVRLTQQSTKRSTVSARRAVAVPGTSAAPPVALHSKNVVLVPGTPQTATVRCAKGEKLINSWKALAFSVADPPRLTHVKDVTTTVTVTGNTVSAAIDTAGSLPFVPLAEVQIGAVCAT